MLIYIICLQKVLNVINKWKFFISALRKACEQKKKKKKHAFDHTHNIPMHWMKNAIIYIHIFTLNGFLSKDVYSSRIYSWKCSQTLRKKKKNLSCNRCLEGGGGGANHYTHVWSVLPLQPFWFGWKTVMVCRILCFLRYFSKCTLKENIKRNKEIQKQ